MTEKLFVCVGKFDERSSIWCMRLKSFFCIVLLICLSIPGLHANAKYTREQNYTYDYWGNPVRSVPAYELEDIIDSTRTNGIEIAGVDDVFAGKDKIYLIDTVESRLNVFDESYSLVKSVKLIRDADGKIIVNAENNKQLMLTNPEGVFVREDEKEIYIADTGAERIIVLDCDEYFLKRIIERPANLAGVTVFKPSKIVVDNAGRIFIVVQGSYEGIIELNSDGSFSRYFGVNKPRVNVVDYFWKSIASDVQKEKMRKVYAPSFNNIDIDKEGFVYATTFDSAAIDKVFRLNAKGENVLIGAGTHKIIGDLDYGEDQQESMFVDIAVSDFGAYALLDKTRGRVFIYNFDGDLLNIFNRSGDIKGNVKEPSSIAWFGKKLIIGDKKLGRAFIFKQTEFGEAALGAAESYYHGRWDETAALLDKALKLNANYTAAYVGIGKNLLMQDEYEKAMYYLKLGNDRTYYSKAFNGYRNQIVQKYFAFFAVIVLIIIVYIVYSEYKYHKSMKAEGE